MKKYKISKEFGEKWVEGLTNGKYKQGYKNLEFCGYHCVLGVFCEMIHIPLDYYSLEKILPNNLVVDSYCLNDDSQIE